MNKNITSTILLVLAIGMYFTVTQGVIDGAKAVQVVNAKYISAMDSADQLRKERDKVRDTFNSISKDDQDRLKKMIPSTVDNIRLIIDISNVARKQNLSLEDIKATVSQAGQKGSVAKSSATATSQPNGTTAVATDTIATPILDTVTVTFKVTAPYQQFKTFMQELEASLRIMDMTSLTLTANDTGTYDYKVELKTYWMRSQ